MKFKIGDIVKSLAVTGQVIENKLSKDSNGNDTEILLISYRYHLIDGSYVTRWWFDFKGVSLIEDETVKHKVLLDLCGNKVK